jgi:hypothetical protein
MSVIVSTAAATYAGCTTISASSTSTYTTDITAAILYTTTPGHCVCKECRQHIYKLSMFPFHCWFSHIRNY